MYQLSFDMTTFMQQVWQKKPLVIKQGFINFEDPISADELAGLSLEQEIDSRFISNLDGQWKAIHGPLEESLFTELPETHWQLVIQAANHWHAGPSELMAPFKSLPQWLFDDVMVCYSAPGGGVGPHIDQYDVFIIQGQGKRRWRVGAKDHGQYQEVIQGGALRQIESFDAEIDEILEPGDILYIPPGFPHQGDTLEASLSYSIGYRSPKEQELLSNFADYVLAHDIGDEHLHKPEMLPQHNFAEIRHSDLASLNDMLRKALNDEHCVQEFIGAMLSQSRHQLNIIAPSQPLSEQDIQQFLFQGECLYKVPGLKSLYHQGAEHVAYINGERFEVEPESSALLTTLCNHEQISLNQLPKSPSGEQWQLITSLVNKGYWYFDVEEQY
ncbi:50S ribosomal protein L16 3-hydroxylase [Vibrio xiamenensis]|uniref:50S ribosomal protein L16 3-hydroxylase n=1 Tax=Vibrio xiamenensis TaxID=861298 RepID=A0A1G7WPP7_9VIBR|nr:cupin domain-containing protein [Vibrio xiamenensis]SDG73955.1 50S ribosomal protein L16 3-hydroxylase [Vibrio xiamenensis]